MVFPSSCRVNVQHTGNLALLGLPNNIVRREKFAKTQLCVILYRLLLFSKGLFYSVLNIFCGYCLKVRYHISESHKKLF
jgi:hypothetical protein